MITLYHGSNMQIGDIDLTKSKPGKDFGRGFYLNPDSEQAWVMAERTVRRMACGVPTLNVYAFDELLLADDSLNIKVFDDYSEEWARFILLNRQNSRDIPAHTYDVVIGPIADDTVGVQLHRFMMGYIPMERMIEELRFRGNRAVQYFFGTEKAIKTLKRIEL